MSTLLDPGQAVRHSFDDATDSFKVTSIAGALITVPYDYVALTYVPSGNGAGEIQTATFKTGGSGGTSVGVLTLTYNAANKLDTVTKS